MLPTPFTSRNAPPSAGAASALDRSKPDPLGVAAALLDQRGLSKLKWRCRRGLLENDLLIERFFLRHEATLTVGQARGLNDLMNLADNDLLDLLLRRKEPGELSDAIAKASATTPDALVILNLLRPAATSPRPGDSPGHYQRKNRT